MTAALRFDRVSFSYDAVPVLRSVSCEIAQGAFVGIIGPNGGGKTTFLKLAMGFLEPTEGSVLLLGNDPQKTLAGVAYVPQNLRYDRLFPLSVMELVQMGLLSRLPWWGRLRPEDQKLVHAALARAGIEHLAGQAVGSLSGGQFQRALIARALVSDPKILILDEPTANIDTTAERDIYDLLKRLSGKMTILMVTHDLHVAVDLVDTILCLQGDLKQMMPQEVCQHFSIGLYHPPLMGDS